MRLIDFAKFIVQDDGIRTRCQYGIGEGKIVKKERLPHLDCALDVVAGGGHTGDTFWNELASKGDEDIVAEQDEEEMIDSVSLILCFKGQALRTIFFTNIYFFIYRKCSIVRRAAALGHSEARDGSLSMKSRGIMYSLNRKSQLRTGPLISSMNLLKRERLLESL